MIKSKSNNVPKQPNVNSQLQGNLILSQPIQNQQRGNYSHGIQNMVSSTLVSVANCVQPSNQFDQINNKQGVAMNRRYTASGSSAGLSVSPTNGIPIHQVMTTTQKSTHANMATLNPSQPQIVRVGSSSGRQTNSSLCRPGEKKALLQRQENGKQM